MNHRGWMGARSQFDLGDEDSGPYHLHPCESCGSPVECEDSCDDESQTIVKCFAHKTSRSIS
jgi:hypothetical protein